MKKSLIYLEPNNYQNSVDLLEVARQMYADDAYETYAVSFASCCREAEGLFDYLIEVLDQQIQNFDIINTTNVLEELQQVYQFDSILIPATHIGRMLAPRMAMRLHVGLVADVTAIKHTNGVLEMVRPAFSGKIMAGIVNRGRIPVMMSIRQNVFTYQLGESKNSLRIEYHPKPAEKSKIELLSISGKEKTNDIRDSEVLVSGGGGTMRYFRRLKLLADEMNSQVSASRRIVDSGIASRSIQVGQSGKTVAPRLYIALGIYGSLQHIEGLKNVESIISVNTNKHAPICSLSDIVVEGDAEEFIEKLVDKIKREKRICHENDG